MFHMTDVISLLGIPFPKSGQNSYYVPCPCCDDNPRDKHLNINLVKEVFRCPRCGVSGGIFDLYSVYTGLPRSGVYRALVERLGPPESPFRPRVRIHQSPNIREYPITDVETRHATYNALLSRLSLAKDHRENLLNRGLTDEEIARLGYKTTPIIGMASLAKQLQSEGYYLSGVPGFYRTETNSWSFIHEKRGILVPVRDVAGRIQGLQIRRDNVDKRKFRWVSSADMKDGCKAEGWTHLAGPVSHSIILTEGPMKSDIIFTLSGHTTLAVPGVNSLTQLKKTLDELRKQGLEEIKVSFDMDYVTNPHVQNGYNNLLILLDQSGLRFGTYVWDPRYKGLDDYIWESLLRKKR